MDLLSLFLQILFISAFVLPFLSAILINWREDRRRWQAFHMAACGLAMAAGLFIGLPNNPNFYWLLWGNWLFIGAAAAALILEISMLAAGKNASRELTL